MPSLEQLSKTLEKIYAAAADPTRWEEALVAIEEFTGSAGAVLNLIPKRPGAVPGTYAGSFTREQCEKYSLCYMTICPRIAFALSRPDLRIQYDSMILSEEEMDRDATYAWFAGHGLRYHIAGRAGETDDYLAAWSLQRTSKQGHVEHKDIERFAMLQRHMDQAIALAAKIGTLEQRCRFGIGLLEVLPYAVVALDATGRVLFMNGRAEQLTRLGDGLLVRDGQLEARVGIQQPLLQRLIRAAVAPEPAQVHGGWARLRRTSGRRSYLMLISQLKIEQEVIDDFQPKALVILHNPDEAAVPEERALYELYDLSGSEARVATEIARGHSIQSASECLQVSPETLRSHLKHIFRKVGINRQQDLVRQLTEIAFLGGGERLTLEVRDKRSKPQE